MTNDYSALKCQYISTYSVKSINSTILKSFKNVNICLFLGFHTYENVRINLLITGKSINLTCNASSECLESLICIHGECKCDQAFEYWTGSACTQSMLTIDIAFLITLLTEILFLISLANFSKYKKQDYRSV